MLSSWAEFLLANASTEAESEGEEEATLWQIMSGEKSRAKKVEKKIDDSCPARGRSHHSCIVRQFDIGSRAGMSTFLVCVTVSAHAEGTPR